jgi:Ca2+-binding RTX toxin-like protein
VARAKRVSPPRAALFAATAAVAALAFPGIASATVTPTINGTDLTVTSTADEEITIACASPAVSVNGAPIALNCADLTSLVVQGGPGANTINLAGVTTAAFTHSPAPTISVHGNGGNDTITGSEFADTLYGDDGNDSIVPGKNPTGTTDDARGGAGDDSITWNPGQGDDLNEGGDGNDTSVVNGGGGGEQFTVKPSTLPGKTVRFDRTGPSPTPGPFFIEIGTTETLDMNANGGDDTFAAENGLAGLIKLDVDGGVGNDVLTGGDGADLIEGGDGNDTITAGRNPTGTTDDARGGAGDDRMIWNPGQGDDLNEGGDGSDTVEVNGGSVGEDFTVKPGAAGRVRFDRTGPSPTPGAFFIDIGTSENLVLNAGAGNDEIKGFPGLAGLIKSTFNGQDGNDEIRGTDGEDLLSGGNGFDQIRAIDKAADQVECDGGLDFARVDRRDTVRGCEIVLGGRLRVSTKAKSLRVSGGAAALKLECVATQRCRGIASLHRGNRTLASARFAMGKNKTQIVMLKLTAAGRRALARAGGKALRVELRIDAKDAKGNGWRSTANLRLR